MFTGIIESIGVVRQKIAEGNNIRFEISSDISNQLKIDQSVSHNGVCLTVVKVNQDSHEVVAVDETLKITNLSSIETGNQINLERSMKLGDRLDGHLVQGHIDCTANCVSIENQNGSHLIKFYLPPFQKGLLISKGSVTIDGISLTVVNIIENHFEVAIIPYTYENTNIKNLRLNKLVNIEFDIVGKYILNSQTQ